MKSFRLFALSLLPLLGAPLCLRAEERPDPKKVVNLSNSFLKEREPEMTSEEYALYEKIVAVINAQPELAVRLLEGLYASGQEKPSPAFEFVWGNVYFMQGRNEEAIVRYRSALDRYPSFQRAWVNLGTALYAAQKYGEAVPCFAKALTLGDRTASTYAMLGYCHERVGDTIQAELCYTQAFIIDPQGDEWVEGLMRVYVKSRQYARAEDLVRELVRRKPAEGRYWQAYARVLLQQGKKLEAISVLETCNGAGLAHAEEYGLLADLYLDFQLTPEAVKVLKKLRDQNASLGERRLLDLASTLVAGGKLEQGEAVLSEVPKPSTPALRNQRLLVLANLDMAKKRWRPARVFLEEILLSEPLNGSALLVLGKSWQEEGDVSRAALVYEAALRAPESAFQANVQLANLELKDRHYEKAVGYLEKALTYEKHPALESYLSQVKKLLEKPNKEVQ